MSLINQSFSFITCLKRWQIATPLPLHIISCHVIMTVYICVSLNESVHLVWKEN